MLVCQKGIFTVITTIDYCISLPQLQKLSDFELRQLLLYSKCDMEEIFRARCTYYMCVMESNRRTYDKWPCEMDVISYVNIYDEDKNVIFGYGGNYMMYVINGAVLVYNDQWIPYLFGSDEEDIRCVWKYFCVPREEKCITKEIMN